MTRDVEPEDFDDAWEGIVAELSDLDGVELADADEFDLAAIGGDSIGTADGGSPGEDGHTGRDEDTFGNWEDHADGRIETVASLSAGPRDWSPAEEEEDEGFVEPLPSAEETPTARHTKLLWLGSGIFILVATLAALGAVSGGPSLALGTGAAGFALAAAAAFSSSPRAEDVDPFDDGARL